ncbi:hypothetical protein HMPREF1982_00765 [Clostridiales bacterium oral taxon 876 str. F0540]|nr:hypothetical protein HMPREF1982_00765 [Clostridiales bacterium oral taxon 876 str. F0540]
MRKKAIISVTSKQTGSDDSVIEVVTPGEFYKEGNSYFAVYNETELSGMEGTTTTLKVDPDSFILSREGTTATEMKFKKYNSDLILYNTPYGVMEMKVETKDLAINLDENGGDVAIKYNLTIAGQNPQNTILKVNIKA